MAQMSELQKKNLQKLQKEYEQFQNAPKYDLNSEEVYCICRKPDNDGELMVACDGCDEWFHFKCMKLDKRNKDLVKSYFCKFCDNLFNKGKTLWKKKCKVLTCYKPINGESQFCSADHGKLYWSEYLNKFSDENFNFNNVESISKSQAQNLISLVSSKNDLIQLGEEFPKFDKGELRITNEQKLEIDSNTKSISKLSDNIDVLKYKLQYIVKLKEVIQKMNEILTDSLDPENLDIENSKNNDKNNESNDENENKNENGQAQKKKRKVKRNKKTKKLKIDICGFDKRLLLADTEWATYCTSDKCKNISNFSNFDDSRKKSIIGSYKSIKEFIENGNDVTLYDFNDEDIFQNICYSDKRKCQLHNGWYNIIKESLELKINEKVYEIDRKNFDNEKLQKFIQISNWKLYCGES